MTHFDSTKTIITYGYLASAADHLLEKAETEEAGSFYTSMMAMVATAFFLEAYLNHLGEKVIPFWANCQRLQPTEKLSIVLYHLRVKPDFGRRPYQTFARVFWLRNALAHGRTETVTGSWKIISQLHAEAGMKGSVLGVLAFGSSAQVVGVRRKKRSAG